MNIHQVINAKERCKKVCDMTNITVSSISLLAYKLGNATVSAKDAGIALKMAMDKINGK